MKHTKLEGGFLTRNVVGLGLILHSHPVARANTTGGVGVLSDHLASAVALDGRSGLGSRGSVGLAGSSTGLVIRLLLVPLDLGSVLLVLVHSPVENVVVLEALADKEVAEDLAEVAVVGLVVEAQGSGVVEVDGELVGEATAEDLGRSGHLLLHDAVVLLLLRSSLQTLPWQRSTAEVQHDVTEGLHVVTAGLLCGRVSGL